MSCHTYSEERILLGARAVALDGRMPFAEPGAEPNYGPSRSCRIEHITLTLSVDVFEKRFSGSAQIRFSLFPGVDAGICFDLDDVTVSGVVDADGSAVDWSHDGEQLSLPNVTSDGEVIVSFEHDNATRGLYFTGPEPWAPERQHMAWTQCQDEDAHFIFPCHDHPGSKHTWTFHIRTNAGYTILSNGECVAEGDDENGAFAHYEQREPMPAYLVNVVAAQLVVEETSWRGRSVRYLAPVGEDEAVNRAFAKTPLMLDAYSDITGVEYPWPRYDQVVVHDFIFGGMENVACTTMTDLLLVDAEAALEWDPDRLVCHELAHQWFGDLLTCQDWSQGWLNESWATFMEVVWWEADRPAEDCSWYAYNQMNLYLQEDGGSYRRPIVSYRFREPIDVFDRHLYEKGACVLRTMRTELGAEAFWAGTKLYLDRHRHGTVHTRHFQRAMEEATGRNLDQFFDQWIFGAGHPDLHVTLGEEKGLLTVGVSQKQSGEDTAKAFHFPLVLEVVYEDGEVQNVRLPVAERDRTWSIPVAKKVAVVRVDPGFNVLATIALKGPRGWLEKLAADTCPVLAARAIQGLLKQGSTKAQQSAFKAFADHPAWQTRQHIAGKIAAIGGDAARDVLIAQLKGDADPRVRRACASALGKFRDAVVADALLEVIAADEWPTPHFRGAVLQALGATRDPRAVDAIQAHLEVPSWGETVLAGALRGLASTEDASVLPILMAHTERSRSPRARMWGAAALGMLGDRVESTRQAVVDRLSQMLGEPGFREILTAMGSLAKVHATEAIPALARIHASAADGRTRRVAYEAMYRIRKGRTTEAGLASLRSQLDQLNSDHTKLRARLEKLER